MTAPAPTWDVPAAEVEANVRVLTLAAAAARTHSPSDALAFRMDAWLVTHPDAPVSTGATYPDWTPGGAS